MANVAALQSVLEFITANPEKWNQGQWWEDAECGTSGCVAGWAVKHSPNWSFHPNYGETNSVVISNHLDERSTEGVDDSVRAVQVETAAEEVLGLDRVESLVLFYAHNNLAALWATAEAITDGLISAPDGIRDSSVCGYFRGESYGEYVRLARDGIIRIRKTMERHG